MAADPLARVRISDLVAGYVTAVHPDRELVDLRTSDGRPVRVGVDRASAELLRNLGEPHTDLTSRRLELLTPGRHVLVHGIYSPTGEGHVFDATRIVFLDREPGEYAFARPGWWTDQLRELAAFYRRAQFGSGEVDFTDYRTILRLGGDKSTRHVQETDTISRLVYGMASAFLLTGEDDFLDVAERGTRYLRDHMRFADPENDVVYWYHGIDVADGVETKLFSSEFGDDYHAIPAYEQIYALAGPTQTYRITGDPEILDDVDATVRLFHRFFRDEVHGGYFSHIDPVHLSPHHGSLGANRARKNWNSIGDHAPAYLINLFLATGRRQDADLLQECFDLIVEHFPDPSGPFVQERFHADWTPDREWGWQQDRAVVGHNLKIAWNLMRMNAIRPDDAYTKLARTIAETMPAVAGDAQRGGWYDVMERVPRAGVPGHRLTWHDRKAWWQQEQGVLAYLILAGNTGEVEFLRHARESAAFYNAFFLDHDEGGVYFMVLADGTPYLLGTERLKGSHSMSMYHSAELCYLAEVYERLLVRRDSLDLWFRPRPDGFADRVLRVAPDALPPGSVRLQSVEVDGKPWDGFDPERLTVRLPDSASPVKVRARLVAS
ncbi:AGE family epimerase/isomerase, partial [Actinosynnema sp. NPDC023658]|uniref:AGE family epimerase/isomerase n=1 Tax=Actinosynnema sp. NPDC023658 TaxID=3155465 RepID=UPI0033E12F2E